jgi:hypothetical protein
VNPLTDQVTWNLVGGQPTGSRGTKIVGSPAVGDIDGDGWLEIVQGTNEEYVRGESGNLQVSPFANLFGLSAINGRVYAVDHEGSASPRVAGNPAGPYLPGWPVKIGIFLDDLLPTVGHGVSQGAALADLDGDGAEEVAVTGSNGPVYLLRGDGSSFLGLASNGKYRTLDYDILAAIPQHSGSTDFPLVLSLLGAPTIGDLRNDGSLLVATGTAGTTKLIDAQAPARQEPGDHQISAWDPSTGHMLDTFPQRVEDLMFFGNPTIADVDGDGLPELIQGNGGGFIHAFNHLGAEPAGWPKFTNQWMIPIPVVGDIDGDGLLEVVAASREGFLTVWETSGPATPNAVQWAGYRHDRQRTGSLLSGVPAGLLTSGCAAGVYPLTLKLAKVKNNSHPNLDTYTLKGTFRLAANVLDPTTDEIGVRLSGATAVYDGTIAGGLPLSKTGYKFNGTATTGGGDLKVELKTKDHRNFKLTAIAKHTDVTGTAVPLGTALFRIGNDCFAASVPCRSAAAGKAQVCKPTH